MTTLQANPSVTLAEALRRLEETGSPIILRGPDGKDCAALVSLTDLRQLGGSEPRPALLSDEDRMPRMTQADSQSIGRPAPALAPDGLPWPEGYFDRAPVLTLEEAIREFGVRPSRYILGRPAWSPDERRNPAFKWPYPPEPEWASDLAAEEEAQKPKRPQ